MTGAPNPSNPGFRLTPRFWIVLAIAVVVIVAVVLAGVLYARGANGDASAEQSGNARPVPSEIPAASAAPTLAPEPTVDPADTRPRPTECAQLFSTAVTDQIPEGFELNPEWSASPDYALAGMTDIELMSMLASADKLSCTWGSPGGPGGEFIRTDFAWVTDAVQQQAIDRMQALGYSCSDEEGGTRCTIDESSDDTDIGQSHFLREGVWIATRWIDLAPDGYTHDIIANTFG